jgi:DNA-binding response OmpR family regulator
VLNDEATSRHLEAALKEAGISFRSVTDGKQALAEIESCPSIAVVELTELAANGREIVQKARGQKNRDQIKIVGLAEQLDDALRQELTGIGVNAMLEKPFKIEDVVAQIREILAAITPAVDVNEFADQFLVELEKLPAPEHPTYLEQAKRLGHNLVGTAGLVSNTQLHDAGMNLEDAAKEQKTELCQEQVKKIHAIIEQMAAKARLMKT